MFDAASAAAVGSIALVFLFGDRIRFQGPNASARLTSAVGGTSAAFVFVIVLPKLADAQPLLQQVGHGGLLGYLELHSFLLGLLGLLLFWALDRMTVVLVSGMIESLQQAHAAGPTRARGPFWRSLLYTQALAFACYVMLVGYLIAESSTEDYATLGLFSLAMALHCLAITLALSHELGEAYARFERWLLAAAILLGWVLAQLTQVSPASLALWGSLFAGMLMFFVIRHEIPSPKDGQFVPLLLGAAGYAALALLIEQL